jgi:hypothetical protein
MVVSTPWAVLLCKFKDNTSEPRPRKFYEDLFTDPGIGKQNMVAFFRDMSHGTLDLSGSKIFGWYTFDNSLADYDELFNELSMEYPENPNFGRHYLTDWAVEAAEADKVKLSEFYGTVVVLNIPKDLFGGWKRAVCSDDSLKPSLLGQEMGHGYGLDHSRSDLIPKDDLNADYKDAWDVMSTAAAYMGDHPVYGVGSIGPGLNAPNMDSRGWLDNSRVRKIPYATVETVDLHPLHNLSGEIAISIDNYYVEFRMNEGWDAGFPRPVVLIHYFEDNHSYLMGRWDWATSRLLGPGILSKKGDKFEIKRGTPSLFYYHLKIELENIDVTQRIARISIEYEYNDPSSVYLEPIFKTPIWKFELRPLGLPLTRLGLAEDTVIVNEKIIRTPEWSFQPILKSLADISSSERFKNEDIRRTIRQESLETIIKIANKELLRMKEPGGVAPSHDLDGQSQQSK